MKIHAGPEIGPGGAFQADPPAHQPVRTVYHGPGPPSGTTPLLRRTTSTPAPDSHHAAAARPVFAVVRSRLQCVGGYRSPRTGRHPTSPHAHIHRAPDQNIRWNLALPQLDRELIPAVLPAGQQAQRYRTSLVFRIVMFLIFSHTGPFRDDLQNDRLSVPGLPRKHTTRNQTLDRAGRRRYSAATANWLQSQGYRLWLHSFRNCSRTAKPSHP